MKLHVIGVRRMFGIAKDSGQPYDISRLVAIGPLQSFSKRNPETNQTTFTVEGYGLQADEIDLADGALRTFADVKFPCILELETDTVPRGGKLTTVVIGYKKPGG